MKTNYNTIAYLNLTWLVSVNIEKNKNFGRSYKVLVSVWFKYFSLKNG